jgi:hypothetical protein
VPGGMNCFGFRVVKDMAKTEIANAIVFLKVII